jgi:RND family efflux transporter MFP subunit
MVQPFTLRTVVRRLRNELAVGVLGILMGSGCGRPPAEPLGASETPVVREVQTATVTHQAVARTVIAIGELVAREEATLSVKVPGRLDRLDVDLGDVVAQGQLLAQVELRDYELEVRQAEAFLAQARARLGLPFEGQDNHVDPAETSTVQQARARLVEARLNRERLGTLAAQGILATSELEAAEAAYEVAANVYRNALEEANNRMAQLVQRQVEVEIAQKRLIDSTIRAPFAGIVRERLAGVGEYLSVGTPILTLVAIDPLRLRLEIPEREASSVRLDQAVRILSDGEPTAYMGMIRRVSPAIDPSTRMLAVEADVPNDGSLRPGEFAQAEITVAEAEGTLTVPREALATFAGIEKVFVIDQGKAAERPVQTGRRGKDWVEIVNGLSGGESVVLNPGNLQTGQPVRAESAPATASHSPST